MMPTLFLIMLYSTNYIINQRDNKKYSFSFFQKFLSFKIHNNTITYLSIKQKI